MKAKDTGLRKSWQFFAVASNAPHGFTWRWQSEGPGSKTAVTGAAFEYYFDCIFDARQNGYTGPLPAGPRVPLKRWPLNANSGGVSAAGAKGRTVMSVVPLERPVLQAPRLAPSQPELGPTDRRRPIKAR